MPTLSVPSRYCFSRVEGCHGMMLRPLNGCERQPRKETPSLSVFLGTRTLQAKIWRTTLRLRRAPNRLPTKETPSLSVFSALCTNQVMAYRRMTPSRQSGSEGPPIKETPMLNWGSRCCTTWGEVRRGMMLRLPSGYEWLPTKGTLTLKRNLALCSR